MVGYILLVYLGFGKDKKDLNSFILPKTQQNRDISKKHNIIF